MSSYSIVPEIDILIATSTFLIQRGVKPYQFSTPKGAGIDSKAVQLQIFTEIYRWIQDGQDIRPLEFSNKGPDIIGVSETEWWQVECKGAGSGKPQTQRNNFDRALASVTSYYCDKPEMLPKKYIEYGGARPYLGLALPASPSYISELKKRVRQPLRKILNLWILIYETESKKIRTITPDDNY